MFARLARLLLVFVVGAATAGCARPGPQRGRRARCVCTYLTDFDDTARVEVDACVAQGREQRAEAAICAGQSAHNHVDVCACEPPGEACDPAGKDACQNR